MSTELDLTEQEVPAQVEEAQETKQQGGSSSAVYGLGLIGAWAFYLSRATSVREGVMGVLKGFVWPAILVYKLLEFLDME